MNKIVITEKQFIQILNESAETDIMANKEAKRVYEKIKRYIKNDKMKFNLTDEKDFVKDSRGNIHILDGVKFNLSEIGEKYDLDILLVSDIKRNSPDPHYSHENKRIVFFILGEPYNGNSDKYSFYSHLVKIRFSSWVEERVFMHEFIHFLDGNRYDKTYSLKNPKDLEEYYNSPEEYNANSQEIIHSIIKNKNKFIGVSFNYFLKKSLGFASEGFVKNLNDENTKKLKSRLYKIYNKLNPSN